MKLTYLLTYNKYIYKQPISLQLPEDLVTASPYAVNNNNFWGPTLPFGPFMHAHLLRV